MLTFAYIVGGWVYKDAYVIKRIKKKSIYFFNNHITIVIYIKGIHKHLVKSQVHKIRDFLKNSLEQMLKFTYLPTNAIVEKKIFGVGGFWKILYVIIRVGYGKCLRWLTRWVGGVKKGQKYAYVIFDYLLDHARN